MNPHLQCAEQQVSRSNLTKYCACHAERLTYLVLIAYETSFTLRGATRVTIQPHQILRLPHKMTRMHDRRHIWNLISNARSNRYHDPTSPNTAPATKNDTARFQRKSPKTGETSFPMRGRSEHDPSMIRPWKRKPQPASQVRLLFQLTTSIFYCKIQRFAPNLTFKPSPNTAPTTKRYTWPSPSAAPATKSDTWGSPSTAPATQNDSHAWSSSHMKPHFQCAEQQVSRSNLTKYCAWHEIWHCKISKKISKNRWNVISNAGPIRAWSDHDPSMIRPWKRKPQPASQVRLLFQLTTSIFYCKIQRFAPNLTFKPSPNTAPATKSDTWTSPSPAPATKSDTWTSPSTAPATKSDTRTSLLYSTLLDSTLLDSTWLYSTWLYSTWLYSTWLYLTLLDSTWLYLILLDSSWLYLILLDSTWLYSTLLDSTWFYLTLVDSTWFYLTLVDSTLLDSTWLYSTLLELYLILLDSSWLYSTRLYLTLLYSTWLYLTLLDSTWLYSTWLYLTLLYLTLLDFNLTGMSFVYRKFLS